MHSIQNSQNSPEKEQSWLTLLISKTYYRSVVIKRLWCWDHIAVCVDQWNRIENPKINPGIYGQLVFGKDTRTVQWGKPRLCGQLDIREQKVSVALPRSVPKLVQNGSYTWNYKTLRRKHTLRRKLLEGNNIYDVKLGNGFLAQATKGKKSGLDQN